MFSLHRCFGESGKERAGYVVACILIGVAQATLDSRWELAYQLQLRSLGGRFGVGERGLVDTFHNNRLFLDVASDVVVESRSAERDALAELLIQVPLEGANGLWPQVGSRQACHPSKVQLGKAGHAVSGSVQKLQCCGFRRSVDQCGARTGRVPKR